MLHVLLAGACPAVGALPPCFRRLFALKYVHPIRNGEGRLVKGCAPEAENLVVLVQEDLTVKRSEFLRRIDVEDEKTVRRQRFMDAAEGLTDLLGICQIVETVQTADHEVHRCRQAKPLHPLMDEIGRIV